MGHNRFGEPGGVVWYDSSPRGHVGCRQLDNTTSFRRTFAVRVSHYVRSFVIASYGVTGLENSHDEILKFAVERAREHKHRPGAQSEAGLQVPQTSTSSLRRADGVRV